VAESKVRLEVRERGAGELGSAATRALRRSGHIPGVIYGRGSEPTAIAIAERELRRALTGEHGRHAILDVVVDGKAARTSMLKDFQRHAIRGTVTHVDFLEVSLDELITATVMIETEGHAPGVREGGTLSTIARDVQVQARPLEVPDRILIDVSNLGLGESIRLGDIPEIPGVTWTADPDTVLVAILSGRGARRDEDEAEAGAEEGEEPTAEAAAEPAAEADAADAAAE
jgi:large subunit ribosomal protein L25